MNALLETSRPAIAELCRRRSVRRLDLFGSAVESNVEPDDFDFLVDFEGLVEGQFADAYFGLLNDLTSLLGRPVDLVMESAIQNPYFRESVEKRRVNLYAA